MEKTFDVLVRLPAANKTFEMRIPAGLNTHMATLLAARGLESLSEGTFAAAKNCVLAWQDTGKQLDPQVTVAKNGVINGSRLLLI